MDRILAVFLRRDLGVSVRSETPQLPRDEKSAGDKDTTLNPRVQTLRPLNPKPKTLIDGTAPSQQVPSDPGLLWGLGFRV